MRAKSARVCFRCLFSWALRGVVRIDLTTGCLTRSLYPMGPHLNVAPLYTKESEQRKLRVASEEQRMKLLFLDVDGVLNNCEVVNALPRGKDSLGEHQLRLLKTLVSEAGCQIVLISTWRRLPESLATLGVAFQKHGIPVWVGVTPHLKTGRRADEILSWLRENVSVPVVAVGIDDAEDIDIGADHGLPVMFKHLKTDFDHGPTTEIVQAALGWFVVSAESRGASP